MSCNRYIQYVNLPKIPNDIVCRLPKTVSEYKIVSDHETYNWTDDLNQEVDVWGKDNIGSNFYFAFQLMTGDIPKHFDAGTATKLVYLLDCGGDRVYTRFWSDDGNTLLDEYIIEPERWHILKADTKHSVEGIEPEMIRMSVTARVFGENNQLNLYRKIFLLKTGKYPSTLLRNT